jgi:type IV pilus assembly protein PilE
MSMQRRRARGFTLAELMVVVAIVAILAAIALPSYRDSTLKANRAVAKAKLLDVAARQEAFFSDNKVYSNTLEELGFAEEPMGVDANSNWVADDSDEAVYTVSATTSNGNLAFTVTADTVNGQSKDDGKCATFTLTETGLRGATGSLGVACWD